MKIFWLRIVRTAVIVYLISLGVFLISHLGETITYISLFAWLGGTTLGFVIWIVPITIAMLWMFKRIATRQGVDVEDVVFALYELKWYFNRVAYDMNFKRDLAKAVEDDHLKDKKK